MNSKYEKANEILKDMIVVYKNRLNAVLIEDCNSPEVISLKYEIDSLTYALKCINNWANLMAQGDFYQEDNDVHIIVPNATFEVKIV